MGKFRPIESMPLGDVSALALPEIRVWMYDGGGTRQDGWEERYISCSVPREGDYVNMGWKTGEVYRVEWTVIGGKAHVEVFCVECEE